MQSWIGSRNLARVGGGGGGGGSFHTRARTMGKKDFVKEADAAMAATGEPNAPADGLQGDRPATDTAPARWPDFNASRHGSALLIEGGGL